MLHIIQHQEKFLIAQGAEQLIPRIASSRQRNPKAIATVVTRNAFVVTAASGTNRAPSLNATASWAAASSASRVFPIPPGPVRVSRRTSRACNLFRGNLSQFGFTTHKGSGQIWPVLQCRWLRDRQALTDNPFIERLCFCLRASAKFLCQHSAAAFILGECCTALSTKGERQHELTVGRFLEWIEGQLSMCVALRGWIIEVSHRVAGKLLKCLNSLLTEAAPGS